MTRDQRKNIEIAARVARAELYRSVKNAQAISRAMIALACISPLGSPLVDLTLPLDKQIANADRALTEWCNALEKLEPDHG